MLNAKDAHEKLSAAYAILMESTTTREKFTSVRTMLHGLNPGLDNALWRIESHFATFDKVVQGEVIHLTAEHLPENTEEEKKKKRWLLFFVSSWKELKSEVQRVQAEISAAQGAKTKGEKASHIGKIFKAAKGPLGIITIVAAGTVLAMQATAVNITVENKGCATLYPSGSLPVSIPGLSLPTEPLVSGSSTEVTMPGLTVTVDGTKKGAFTLGVLNYTLGFQLPNTTKDVTMNGVSLLGKTTEVKLSEKDQHTLTLVCY